MNKLNNIASIKDYNYYDRRAKCLSEKLIINNSDIVSIYSEDEFDETCDCEDLEI